MKNKVYKDPFEYYKNIGWAINDNGNFIDTEENENLKKVSAIYISGIRRRISNELNSQNNCDFKRILDCASGPVQFKEYLEYSSKFDSRYCVDFSKEALQIAKKNLEADGQNKCFFLCDDFFNLNFENDFFDSAISLHTLLHINKRKQKKFVQKLIDFTKPGMKIIIVYSNPFSLRTFLCLPRDFILMIRRLVKRLFFAKIETKRQFYAFRHPIWWWNNFSDLGEVKIKSYRSFTAGFEKSLIPDNMLGKLIYSFLFKFENYPISKYLSDYYFVVIKKN